MKKLILGAAAVAAMAMAGGASAQSADCARGMYSSDPCGVGGVVVPHPNYGADGANRVYDNSTRWRNANAHPYYNWEGSRDRDRNRGRNDRDGDGIRNARDNDRDGDGVRNSRDRYPDDRRYR